MIPPQKCSGIRSTTGRRLCQLTSDSQVNYSMYAFRTADYGRNDDGATNSHIDNSAHVPPKRRVSADSTINLMAYWRLPVSCGSEVRISETYPARVQMISVS